MQDEFESIYEYVNAEMDYVARQRKTILHLPFVSFWDSSSHFNLMFHGIRLLEFPTEKCYVFT